MCSCPPPNYPPENVFCIARPWHITNMCLPSVWGSGCGYGSYMLWGLSLLHTAFLDPNLGFHPTAVPKQAQRKTYFPVSEWSHGSFQRLRGSIQTLNSRPLHRRITTGVSKNSGSDLFPNSRDRHGQHLVWSFWTSSQISDMPNYTSLQ